MTHPDLKALRDAAERARDLGKTLELVEPECALILLDRLEELETRISILENPSDGRCMEVSVLREHVAKLREERDRAESERIEYVKRCERAEEWAAEVQSDNRRLRESRAAITEALNYLASSGFALLEANNEEIECRGDEDCDHCVFLNALEESKLSLAADAAQFGKDASE